MKKENKLAANRQINVRWPAPEQLVAQHARILTLLDWMALIAICLLVLCVTGGLWIRLSR